MTQSVALGVALALAGCATPRREATPRTDNPALEELAAETILLSRTMDSEPLSRAAQAVRYISVADLPRASLAINAALQLDGRNSNLHFLNAFIYHLQARQGDTSKSEMAVEGYRTAIRLDPGNWIAQEFLGLALLDLKQYAKAREQFAQVLRLSPDSTTSTHGVMITAYLMGDAVTACAMADRLQTLMKSRDAAFVRSGISVYAACGRYEESERLLSELGSLGANGTLVERSGKRLSQWQDYNRAGGKFMNAAAFTVTPRTPPPSATVSLPTYDDASPPAALSPKVQASAPPDQAPAVTAVTPSSASGTPGMVLVDVVIIATQESVSTSKGINLLNALTLQLGSATAPAYSWTFDDSSVSRTVITKAVTIPALAYSLNIANASSSTNEVLARPTLAAMEGLPSEFFAGVNVNAGVLSTSSLGSPNVVPVDKRFGMKLAITPNFLPDGNIQLKVSAQRTFIIPSSDNQNFSYRFDISETSADANVIMKMGDTLVLGGLAEKETSHSRDAVPGLGDVPGVQYLFSKKQETDFQRSALILITPRKPMYASEESLGITGPIPSNAESVAKHLGDSQLFQQFRQGDVAMERWDRSRTTVDRLRQALSFLYY